MPQDRSHRPTPAAPAAAGGTSDSTFVRACRGLTVSHTPVWFMRQAGRSLPEYRRVREGIGMLDSCFRPELVTEITLQPVRRYGVDAAILFSDIVVPLAAVDVDVEIVPGTGPVIGTPVRDLAGVERLRPLLTQDVTAVSEAVTMLVAELGDTPLIGFAGAPFTLASYLVEGGPSRNHERTKALMYGAPQVWEALMSRLCDITVTFLRAQVTAGASAVQLFDSWVGALPDADYRALVAPWSARVLQGVADLGVPRIHFGVGTGELLPTMAATGADVMGVDFRVPLDEANRRLGGRHPLQGNLDPAITFAPWPVVERRTMQILDAGRSAPGHVFNLGHGVLPTTDPDVLHRVVDLVHETTSG